MTGLETLADMLASLPFAAPLRRSVWSYALVNAAHILGIGLLLGAILPLDLRLMGWRSGPPIATLAPFLSRVAATGLALAVVTGVMLLSVQPAEYLPMTAFRVKLLLIALALANLTALHLNPSWRAVKTGGPLTGKVRWAAAVSALCWLAVLVAGRAIGFL